MISSNDAVSTKPEGIKMGLDKIKQFRSEEKEKTMDTVKGLKSSN